MRAIKIAPANLLTHVAAWLPLLILGWDTFAGNLTINPIQDATQRTGKIAINLLLISLAITPLITLTGWRFLNPLRRPLGLYAFFYASLHFLIFSGIDYAFDWELLKEAIFEKPYALVGFTALLVLLPLAATSWRWWMKKLGKNWKKLHRLVYFAGVLVVIHYGWVKKGDLTRLSGDIVLPLTYGGVLAVLLLLRLPPVRRWLVAHRPRGWGGGAARADENAALRQKQIQ